MFEPVHGSAPPMTGKDVANPMAAVLTLGMMLGTLGAQDAAAAVQRAVVRALERGIGTEDVGGKLGTRAVGDWLASEIAKA